MRVLVAMSGGVDSSVVAALMVRARYHVVGLTLQLARSSCGLGACCTGPDLDDVKDMCAAMGFEHYTVPAYEDFRAKVIDYTVDSYAIGLTPVPCVWCNSLVRFQYIFEAMKQHNCDMFATGHYAYCNGDSLYAGIDPNKDQSYFLSMVSKNILQYARFPLGHMHKSTVRRIARALKLPVAAKRDSQDLCFVKDHYIDTLHNINPGIFKPGRIINTQGERLGDHTGVAQFTVGQRRGLGHLKSNNPLYVTDVDANTNQITVGYREDMAIKAIYLTRMNMLENVRLGEFVQAKVRSRSKLYNARLYRDVMIFDVPIYEVAKGQICVIYQGRIVIGSGMITDWTRAYQPVLT